MKNKIVWIGLIILMVLIIGWWLISPLFVNNVVDEKLINTEKNGQNLEAEFLGSFADADSFHKTSGTAIVVMIDGKKYLSLENFKTTNGPDLYVYLSKDKEAGEFVNLGILKGNIGNQIYEIPENVDINSYKNVLIWCRAFGVLFGISELKSQ